MHSASGVIGAADADVLVSLKANHRPTANYVRALRQKLPQEFPGVTFYFLPADIVTQIINFGLPAPIDIQIEGADIQGNRRVADKMLNELRQVPGLADLRVRQRFDYPKFDVTVDRTKAGQGGFTTRDLATSLLVSLSGSFQTTPTFFLNWQNGVNYNLATQTPQYRIQSLHDIQNIPISAPTATRPGILADVASITRSSEMAVLSHYNIRRVVDIHGAVQDRDLGAVGRDVARIVDANRPHLPRGSFLTVRGQLATMRTAYVGLLAGLGFSIVLVYLLIVVNFQSWLDPFIIITALPAALAGIVVFLFLTGTTLSVPALMGAIMSIGVARPYRRHLALLGIAVVAGALGLGIFWGIRGRSAADTTLRHTTAEAAVSLVSVVSPKPGAPTQEILLPGTTQAFTDAPIFARTNGYVKGWYFDIGAHVKQGQLLVEIESPEVDQQLQQAQADLETAQANLRQAQITADRWLALLQSDSVSKQETDQAVSALSAMKATVDSNAANVRRLEQLQGFEKIGAPFDGVITARNVDIGVLINAGANTAGPGALPLGAIHPLPRLSGPPPVPRPAAPPAVPRTRPRR